MLRRGRRLAVGVVAPVRPVASIAATVAADAAERRGACQASSGSGRSERAESWNVLRRRGQFIDAWRVPRRTGDGVGVRLTRFDGPTLDGSNWPRAAALRPKAPEVLTATNAGTSLAASRAGLPLRTQVEPVVLQRRQAVDAVVLLRRPRPVFVAQSVGQIIRGTCACRLGPPGSGPPSSLANRAASRRADILSWRTSG